MATYAQRYKIMRDSGMDPADPNLATLEPPTTAADVTAAKSLLQRIEATIVDVASDHLPDQKPTAGDSATFARWADAVSADARAEAKRALALLLARFDALPPEQILNPNVATDPVLKVEIGKLVPALSLGFPRR